MRPGSVGLSGFCSGVLGGMMWLVWLVREGEGRSLAEWEERSGMMDGRGAGVEVGTDVVGRGGRGGEAICFSLTMEAIKGLMGVKDAGCFSNMVFDLVCSER